jgi:hypothetical protein
MKKHNGKSPFPPAIAVSDPHPPSIPFTTSIRTCTQKMPEKRTVRVLTKHVCSHAFVKMLMFLEESIYVLFSEGIQPSVFAIVMAPM